MTTTLGPARPQAPAARTTFFTLAARETRRFVVNPVFLLGVGMTAYYWTGLGDIMTEIDEVNPYPAIFLGGFGMIAMYMQTGSMRASEPVVGVTPVTLAARTAALCAVAVVPFVCGVLTLFAFLHFYPIGSWFYGSFSLSAQVAVLVGQIVVPSLGGPLLGIAVGRWVRFPFAGFVGFLVVYGWVSLVTIPSLSNPDSTGLTALRLFAPFAFFTFSDHGADPTTWRGSPWFFLGWQVALCAIAVLVALLRGAEGRLRSRITRTLQIVLVVAAILLVLAVSGGFAHVVHA